MNYLMLSISVRTRSNGLSSLHVFLILLQKFCIFSLSILSLIADFSERAATENSDGCFRFGLLIGVVGSSVFYV